MTTDNRTNEPTETQVKLAYLAHLKAPRTRGMDVYGPMRAALVAAQGAAPQAEAYDHCCNHPKCPGGSLCCCVSEQRLRDCWNQWLLEIAGDTKQAFRDGYQAGQNDPAPWLAAPPLPSSGVDEDALAEVIATASTDWDFYWSEYREVKGEDPGPNAEYVARAVIASRAEWLKGQGR